VYQIPIDDGYIHPRMLFMIVPANPALLLLHMMLTGLECMPLIITEIDIGVVPPAWRKWTSFTSDSVWPSPRSGHRSVL